MKYTTTNVYVQRICLPVKSCVNDNPSQNERTASNYIVEENNKYAFILSELTEKNLLLIIIIIMFLHYATQSHCIEHRARQEKTSRGTSEP